ncbi:hypothetical protein Phum_PHUM403040 [Pediculus humanus corporis]|uniref:Uncharacterized protein n=1 Tax=Pediculus humanus subsp. corporis TaxID=121224 RepID=E0VRS5_PEDHC|nr:uncharacterized protein Phum_PHUM403040 [Pediculus humanus corporis]EEB16081.1 hypothetical protein Phum_PHUM403040 [Pediculus humanus corporis]
MAKPTPTPSPKPSVQGSQPSVRSRSNSMHNADYEEFASLQLDKPNESELKTSEEMKKHMYDDHFEGRPIERAMHILTNVKTHNDNIYIVKLLV